MSQALHYTSTYQMTYLFTQHTLGRVQDQIVADSLQAYLYDLQEALSTNDDLAAVRDSVFNYFEQETYGEGDFQVFLDHVRASIEKLLGTRSEALEQLFFNTLALLNPNRPRDTTWSYEELIHYFEHTGSYISETHLDHHEMHSFSQDGWVGSIFIPHFGSNVPLEWTEKDNPDWFQAIVAHTNEVIKPKKK